MLRRIFVFVVFIGSFISLKAQIDTADVFDNPYTTIYNHLYYLQSDSYEPERAALSLPNQSKELSIKLKQFLDGKGLFLDLNRIPQDSIYADSLSGDNLYFRDETEPLLYVERIEGRWVYSRTTVDAIPTLHKSVYPFGTQFVSYFHAPFWQVKIISIKLWKVHPTV